METNEQSNLEADLSAIRDQIARRIWDMTQISLQGPGYVRGYADGLSESLILLDKVFINPIPEVQEIQRDLRALYDNWNSEMENNPNSVIPIEMAISSLTSILEKISNVAKS